MGGKGRGLTSTNWWLQGSHGGVRCSIENTANNTVMTMCGVGGVLDLSG